MASTQPEQPQDEAFDNITAKGTPDGLFQACMTAIRTAHFRSNRIRAFLVVSGLFTDKTIYRAVIAIFYSLTKEAEDKLVEMKDDDEICKKILSLGYHFTDQYEKDLEFLFESSTNWREQAEAVVKSNAAAVSYRQKIRAATSGEELAGVIFVLWGALIIGGGAAAKPRVQSRYGTEATHLFTDVAGPGREKRKRDFIQTWDALLRDTTTTTTMSSKVSKQFESIVSFTQACMQGNNDVLCSLAKNPWWLPYVISGVVGGLSVAVGAVLIRRRQ